MSYLRNRNRYKNKHKKLSEQEKKVFKLRCDLCDAFNSEEFQTQFANDIAISQKDLEEMIDSFINLSNINIIEWIE